MSKKTKPNQSENTQEKSYLEYEDASASEGVDNKKKKPLLERLGLIEPTIKQESYDNLSPIESEFSVALESKINNAVVNNEILDKEDEYHFDRLSINEIFSKFGLESNHTNTIYLIESFIKALPANLPADVKRQSIINIISASQLDVTSLIKDGNARLATLKKHSQDFTNCIDEIVASNNKQICKLNEKIAYHNQIISEKQQVKEEQNSIIDFEIQKLSNIIEFIENRSK